MHLLAGLSLLFIAAPLLWVGSFIPFFGVLAFLPFSDCVLVGAALLVAGLLPFGPWVRTAMACVLWVAASLSLAMAQWPMHHDRGGGVLWPEIRLARTVPLPRGAVLPVHGDAGAWLSARGPRTAVQGEINVAGMRDSAGDLLVNKADVVEPVDILWRNGLVPDVGGPGFPRLVIEREAGDGWTHVHFVAETAPGQVAAEFRRSYPMPPADLGIHMAAPKRIFLSVLHDNLLRMLLGFNDAYEPRRELNDFLASAYGTRPRSVGDDTGPLRKLVVTAEHEETVPEAPLSVETTLAGLAQPGARDFTELHEQPCGKRVSGREYGAAGWRTYAAVMEGGDPDRPIVLNHITPGHAAFAWYCDKAAGRLLSFMGASERASLRVTGYTPEGRLVEVHYFEWPAGEVRRGVVPQGSLRRGPRGELSFVLAQPIRSPGGHRNEPDRYQVLELAGAGFAGP